jgi:hypothetical protein
VNLELSCIEGTLQYEGSVVLEIRAYTPGRKSQKLCLKMGPSALGSVAEEINKLVREQQRRLDLVKRKLRGEE